MIRGGENRRYIYVNYSNVDKCWGTSFSIGSGSAHVETYRGTQDPVVATLTGNNITFTNDTANNRFIIDYGSQWTHLGVIIFG